MNERTLQYPSTTYPKLSPEFPEIHTGLFTGFMMNFHNKGGGLSTGCSQPVVLAVVPEEVIAGVDEVIQGLKQVLFPFWDKIER